MSQKDSSPKAKGATGTRRSRSGMQAQSGDASKKPGDGSASSEDEGQIDAQTWRARVLAGYRGKGPKETHTLLAKISIPTGKATVEVGDRYKETAIINAMIGVVDKMFDTFQTGAYQINQLAAGTDLELNWIRPNLAKESPATWQKKGTDHVDVLTGRLSTRSWTMVVKGTVDGIYVFILSTDRLFGFNSAPLTFTVYLKFSPVVDGLTVKWAVGGTEIDSDKFGKIQRELFEALIRHAKGEARPEEVFNLKAIGLQVKVKEAVVSTDDVQKKYQDAFFEDMRARAEASTSSLGGVKTPAPTPTQPARSAFIGDAGRSQGGTAPNQAPAFNSGQFPQAPPQPGAGFPAQPSPGYKPQTWPAQSVPQQSAPQQMPHQGAPPMPQQMPHQGAPQMPQQGVPQMPQQGAPQMPQQGAPQMPQQGAPQMPQQGAPQMPQQGAPQMPQQGAPQMPQQGAPQMPQQGAPQMPQQGAPQMPQQGAPQMPRQMPSMYPQMQQPQYPQPGQPQQQPQQGQPQQGQPQQQPPPAPQPHGYGNAAQAQPPIQGMLPHPSPLPMTGPGMPPSAPPVVPGQPPRPMQSQPGQQAMPPQAQPQPGAPFAQSQQAQASSGGHLSAATSQHGTPPAPNAVQSVANAQPPASFPVALSMLMPTLDRELEAVAKAGMDAFSQRDLTRADAALKFSGRLSEFRNLAREILEYYKRK